MQNNLQEFKDKLLENLKIELENYQPELNQIGEEK